MMMLHLLKKIKIKKNKIKKTRASNERVVNNKDKTETTEKKEKG